MQASGKSTFYHERFAETHEHVSKDLFRHNKNRGRRQEQLVGEALRSGRCAVVDNTNPTLEDRASLIELAREHGARAIAYYFESGTRDSRERNGRREGKARVPNVAIFATAKKLVPPSRAEGFEEVHRVKISEGSGFEVLPWEGSF
ncbi:MAG: ATP-binding protein [Actinomycetota bacterium]|nr:ATP-binding protein [Actinomycetota bacterium]